MFFFLLSVYNKILVRLSLFFSQGFHMEVCQSSLSMCKNALQFSAHIRINGEGLQRESQYILPSIYWRLLRMYQGSKFPTHRHLVKNESIYYTMTSYSHAWVAFLSHINNNLKVHQTTVFSCHPSLFHCERKSPIYCLYQDPSQWHHLPFITCKCFVREV